MRLPVVILRLGQDRPDVRGCLARCEQKIHPVLEQYQRGYRCLREGLAQAGTTLSKPSIPRKPALIAPPL